MKRIYSLDFLRIVAAVFIIFHHYQQLTGVFFTGELNFHGGNFDFGYLVELFFILSGFLAYNIVDKKELSFSEFFLSKLKRLLPLVFISCIVYEIFLFLYKREGNGFWILGPDISIWDTIVSGLGLQCVWKADGILVNNPVWYISSLLLSYVIFFFLIYIGRRKKLEITYLFVAMILLGVSILECHLQLPFFNQNAARGYCAFFFGLVFAHFTHGKKITWKHSMVCFFLVAGMTYGMANYFQYFENGIRYIMIFIYYPALILLFIGSPLKQMLNYKFIGILGKITYDMYVWHVPILLLLYIISNKKPELINFDLRYTMYAFAGGMVIVGIISHYLIDRPIQRLLRSGDKQHKIKELN